MESIEITFKSISSKNYKLNANYEQCLDDFANQLEKPEDQGIRWIYKGKVLEGTTKIKDLNDSKPLVVFMFIKNKKIIEGTNNEQVNSLTSNNSLQASSLQASSLPVNNTSVNNTPVNNTPVNNTPVETRINIIEPAITMDDKDRNLMGLMTSLVFIRSNPLLTVLFMNDIDKLFEILNSPEMKEIITHVMNGDIQVKKIKKSDLEKEDKSESESEVDKPKDEITESDKANINQLMEISGKSEQECIQAYIICKKDTNNAAFMLLD
jgi:uncharacterized membrane protein